VRAVLILVGLFGRVSIADRPRQPLQQLRSEMLALEVSDVDPLGEHHSFARPAGLHHDLRHSSSLLAEGLKPDLVDRRPSKAQLSQFSFASMRANPPGGGSGIASRVVGAPLPLVSATTPAPVGAGGVKPGHAPANRGRLPSSEHIHNHRSITFISFPP
jgi:hypothetical protein